MESQNHNLLEISNKNSFVGVSPASSNADQVIITQQSQGIHVYSIFDQKCQRSWIVPPSISFGCEAVLDANGNFYTIVNQNKNNNNVWCWKPDVEDLIKNTNSVHKTKFTETIFRIVPSQINEFVAIVQEYGSFQIANPELRVAASHSGDQKGSLGTVCWTDFSKQENVLLIVLELETVYTFQAFDVIYDKTTASCTIKQLASVTFRGKANRPMLACTYESDTQSFCVLWNDLIWDVYKLSDISRGLKMSWPAPKISQNLDSFFSLEKKVKSKGKKPELDTVVNQSITAASLENGLVLFAGPSKENSSQYSLVVWEVNYGTHVHTAYITSSNRSDSGAQFVKLCVSKQKNLVTVCLPQKVEVVSISGQAPNLANLIGKTTSKTDTTKIVQKAVLPAPADLMSVLDKAYEGSQQDALDWKMKPKVEIATPQWKKLIDAMLDTKKTQQDLTSIWSEAVQLAGSQKKLPLLFINATAFRYLTDENLVLDNASHFGQLLRGKLLSGQSSYYTLVPSLIKKNAVPLLVSCLSAVDDLSAYDIVSMIKYITTTGGPHIVKHFNKPNTEQGINAAEQMFLNLVVSHVASHTFMQEAISHLSFPQVLKILTCVHNWIARFTSKFDPTIDTTGLGIGSIDDKHNATPSMSSVISWAALLLDTNYIQIMTNSEKVKPMIQNMFTCVEILVNELRDAVDVTSMVASLSDLVQKRHLKSRTYAISVLQLTEEPFVKPEVQDQAPPASQTPPASQEPPAKPEEAPKASNVANGKARTPKGRSKTEQLVKAQ